MLEKGNFFEQVSDVALYNPQKENHYTVLARNPANEDEIKLMNIWKDGKFMFDNVIYPKNRLTVSNLGLMFQNYKQKVCNQSVNRI